MSQRSRSQSIGAQGQKLVAHIIESSGLWIARSQDEDYGIDLEAEYSEHGVHGYILKLQVKSTGKPVVTPKGIKFPLSTSLIKYADSLRVPLIQIQVEATTGRAWYLWIQRWILELRKEGIGISELPKNRLVYTSVANTLENGLNGDLIDIACWRTPSQLFITINDAIRTAASVGRIDALNQLVSLLAKTDVLSQDFPIDLVIDHILEMRSSTSETVEAEHTSQTLFTLCHFLGKRITVEQIQKLVLRGDEYSRVGVNALGVLYDSHYEHIESLNLANVFMSLGRREAAFFCALRESFGRQGPGTLVPEFKFEYEGIRIDSSGYGTRFWRKWASRGYSVIFDYLEHIES